MENSKKQKVFSAAGIRLYRPVPKETQKMSQGGLVVFSSLALLLILVSAFISID